MSDTVTAAIDAIQDEDTAILRSRWQALTGRQLPDQLPRNFIRRLLAYRIQAVAYGDLDARTARVLDRIANKHGGPSSGQKLTLESLGLSSRGERKLRPGTVLVREHDGIHHHVMVVDDGFSWSGKTYRSLSAVARAITGTRWNGRRFFGLISPEHSVEQNGKV